MSHKTPKEDKLLKKKLYNAEYNRDPIKRAAKLENAKRYRNLPEVKARIKQWSIDNADWKKEYQKKNKERTRLRYIRLNYGLQSENYFILLKKQNNKCAICYCSIDELSTKNTHIDHCHITKKVRGILCRYCNLLLGFSRENEAVLKSAIKYIKKHA